MTRKANTSLNQVFWSYSKKSKALEINLDSLFFLFFMHHCLVSKLVSKEAVIPTLPSLPCPASIPVLFHPSYGSKAMPKECQSRVKILQCHREIVHSSLCARVSQHGVAVAAQMSLMVILHFWFMLQEHTARLTPGVGEMILMFSVSCFQKSPLLHVWKTAQSSTSERLMLRATINAIN